MVPGLVSARLVSSNTWPSSLGAFFKLYEICTLWHVFSSSGFKLLRCSKLKRFANWFANYFLFHSGVRDFRENVLAVVMLSLLFGFCSEFQGQQFSQACLHLLEFVGISGSMSRNSPGTA